MTAVLTTHRCPKCGSDVQVYAREATVWHACGMADLAHKMVRFEALPIEVMAWSPSCPS